jgi:hypothetical protein
MSCGSEWPVRGGCGDDCDGCSRGRNCDRDSTSTATRASAATRSPNRDRRPHQHSRQHRNCTATAPRQHRDSTATAPRQHRTSTSPTSRHSPHRPWRSLARVSRARRVSGRIARGTCHPTGSLTVRNPRWTRAAGDRNRVVSERQRRPIRSPVASSRGGVGSTATAGFPADGRPAG